MMLQKRVPVWMLLAAMGGLLLLFGIGSAIHSAGWWDGFTMGLLSSGADGTRLAPYMAYRGGSGWHGGGFGFFGGLFRLLFFLLVIGLIFKFLGFWRWRMHGSNKGWTHHGWRHHGEPWPRHERGPSGEGKPQDTASTHL